MDIQGKVVVVTGAGGEGSGRAIATRFAKQGATVVVSDIAEAGGRETVTRIEAAAGKAVWCAADVRSEKDVRNLIAAAESCGDFRVLVNNASAPFHPDDPLDYWPELVQTDLIGTMYGTRFAIGAFRRASAYARQSGHARENGGCSVVNVSSISALWHGRANASPGYDAAKAGVIRLTTMLASVQESDGIRVNCLAPGWIASPQVLEYWSPLTPEQRKERGAPSRLLQPDEVAEAVFRLATDESLYGRVMLWWSEDSPQLIPWGDRGYEATVSVVRP